MNINYVWEKLHGAVYCLVGSTSIKERLIAAYQILAFLPEENVPFELREEYKQIMDFVNNAKPKGEKGKIEVAVERATEVEASYMGKKILSLYDTITRQMEPRKYE